jgi:hypothetical protein
MESGGWSILAGLGGLASITHAFLVGLVTTYVLRVAVIRVLRLSYLDALHDGRHPGCACLRAVLDWRWRERRSHKTNQ